MPKRRDGIMTVRIPTDEKNVLLAIADHLDITLSDVVVKASRDFIEANAALHKKIAPKTSKPSKAPAKIAAKFSAKVTAKTPKAKGK